MLEKKYYENFYRFINQGIIIFDKNSKLVEYANNQLFDYLNFTKENIDFNICLAFEGVLLKKSEMVVHEKDKVIFTTIEDNKSKKLLKKGPMVIFTWLNKENWPTTYVSENIKEILGYTTNEFLEGELFYSDIIHTEDLNRVSKEVEDAVNKDKEFFHHEPYRLRCKDGHFIWISDFTVLIKDYKGKIVGFHGYINNINELMKTRNALIEQEERSKAIIEAADLGTWEWDYKTGEIKHNDKWFEMLNYKPENFKSSDINAIISHPEDLEKAKVELQKHINGEKDYYEIERRIKRKDNSYAWILDKGRIIKYSDDETPQKIFGVHVDISQQKIIEERFKLFMDSAEEIFIILNDALRIIEINQAALLLISESAQKREIIGKKIYDVLPVIKEEINNYKLLMDNKNQMAKTKKFVKDEKNTFYEFSLFKINNDIGLIGHNITSSVLYQQSIEQMNKNFNKILSASPFGVVLVTMNRKVKWANDQALNLFGVNDLNEIKDRYCQDFICINNEDRKCPLDGISNFKTVECKIRNKNNQLIEVMKKATLIEYENEKVVLESFVDISDRKAMERKLEKETDRLKNIYRIANIGVFDFDFINEEFYMNKNQYKIIEVSPDIPKSNLINIIKNRIGEDNYEIIQNIPKNDKFALEIELETPSKKKYVKIYGSTKSKFNERFQRIIGACIDITDLKEAENRALLASQSKSAFLANMSHEIRTPLNGILGFTEALLETNLNPKQIDYLNTIKYSGISLTEIIEDILNLSKIEAGKMTLVEEFVDLRQIVSEAVDILKLESYEKGIKLLYNVDIQENSLIKLDSVRIKQVLINLLGNAVKFTEKGIVQLNIKLSDDKKYLYFEIIDSGIGISSKDQKKIMESFYQGDPQITRKYGGTGLGLTISNRILNLMGSSLNVESQLGEGSKFYFEIAVAVESSGIDLKKSTNERILVVDAVSISRNSLEQKINGLGHIAVSAKDIDDGMNIINRKTMDKVFISSDFNPSKIIDFFNRLEQKGLRIHCFIYSFELYNKDFVQKRFNHLTYEYISRPLSRRKIRDIISGYNSIEKDLTNKFIQTNRKVKLLVAEDNRINMKLAKTFIKSILSNVEIYEAVNGTNVLSILDVRDIDLIFMDIQMPLMDGIETTKSIRTFDKSIPIIGLTALTQTEDELKSKAIGMNDYIRKPISKQKIYEILVKWIN